MKSRGAQRVPSLAYYRLGLRRGGRIAVCRRVQSEEGLGTEKVCEGEARRWSGGAVERWGGAEVDRWREEGVHTGRLGEQLGLHLGDLSLGDRASHHLQIRQLGREEQLAQYYIDASVDKKASFI